METPCIVLKLLSIHIKCFIVIKISKTELKESFCYNSVISHLKKLRYYTYLVLFTMKGLADVVQGPVVQSIVRLTSLLRGQLVKCFTTL